jgi:hypothetical protein
METIKVRISGIYDNKLQHMIYTVYHNNDKLFESVYLDECEYYCDENNYEIIESERDY